MRTSVAVSLALIAIVGAIAWFALQRHSNVVKQTLVDPPPAVASAAVVVEPELAPSAEAERAPAARPAVLESSTTTADPFALVRVLVLDKATNAPVNGAGVNASYERTDRPRRKSIKGTRGQPFDIITSGADGRVEIESPPGVKLRVSASGPDVDVGSADMTLDQLEQGKTYEVTLVLPSGFDMPFWLRVVDEVSRAPIAGAAIANAGEGALGRSSSKKSAPTTSTAKTTDANGLLLLDARTWRTNTFEITARGYGKGMIVAERGHATAELAYVLELRRGAQLNVRVLDAQRAPLPRTRIALSCSPYEIGRRESSTSTTLIMAGPHKISWNGTTDANGRFTFEDLPAHVWLEGEMSSTPPWSEPKLEPFEAGETRNVEWIVGLVHTVRGLVVDAAGTPIPKCEVWLKQADHRRGPHYFDPGDVNGRKTTTDADGRFVLDGVESGAWWVGPGRVQFDVQSAAATPAPLGQFVEITDAMADADIELRVDRGLFIRGIVLDAEDRPAVGARVSARLATARVYFLGTTDADGSFTLGPLMADRYEVAAHKQSGENSAEKLVVRAGENGLVLHLSASCTVSGRVVDETGAGVTCMVSATSPGTERKFFMGTNTQRDGAFNLSGVDPGPVHLYASTGDGRFGSLAVPAIEPKAKVPDIVLRVTPGGRVRIRQKGPERYPELTLMHGADVVGFTNLERDALEEFVVPLGRLTVRLRIDADDRTVVRELDVEANKIAEVVFDKEPR